MFSLPDLNPPNYEIDISYPIRFLLITVGKDEMSKMERIVREADPEQKDEMACLRALVAEYPTLFAVCRSPALSELVYHIIAKNGPKIVKELHELLPNCLAISFLHRGNTLHLCAKESTADMVKAILEVEPKLAFSKREIDDSLALHHCSSADMVSPLVEAYPESVNCRDKYGSTPLHYAASMLKVDVVAALLKHGAHTNIKNNYGNLPIELPKNKADKQDDIRTIIGMLNDATFTKRAF